MNNSRVFTDPWSDEVYTFPSNKRFTETERKLFYTNIYVEGKIDLRLKEYLISFDSEFPLFLNLNYPLNDLIIKLSFNLRYFSKRH